MLLSAFNPNVRHPYSQVYALVCDDAPVYVVHLQNKYIASLNKGIQTANKPIQTKNERTQKYISPTTTAMAATTTMATNKTEKNYCA